jgi:hypothetical protein
MAVMVGVVDMVGWGCSRFKAWSALGHARLSGEPIESGSRDAMIKFGGVRGPKQKSSLDRNGPGHPLVLNRYCPGIRLYERILL